MTAAAPRFPAPRWAWRTWLSRVLWVLGGLLMALAGAAGLYAWRASPASEGTLQLAGANGEIRILRDAHGIPTIRAGSVRDVMFGLGVAHAQDRLWQLETHRRIGAGRLAEAFGEGALETDRFLRALGVRRAAQAQWDATQGESREVLEAYAAGVNAVMRQALKARPPEFLILGLQPEEWTPVDSLAWTIMMAWDLGGNWNSELQRMRLALKFPVQRVDELMPPYPGEKPLVTADYAALYRELKIGSSSATQAWLNLPDLAPPSGVEGVGSNNWVLSGQRSTTGAPLLANDPHLKLSAPALWYFARLEAPGLKAAGATMPGVPSIVLGQNADIAWGFTNTGPDVQDLYLERVKAGDAAQYQTPEGWAAFGSVDEEIRVKGRSEAVRLKVRSTRHGPVISDAGTAADLVGAKGGSPDLVLAMRWTALGSTCSIDSMSAEGMANSPASWRKTIAWVTEAETGRVKRKVVPTPTLVIVRTAPPIASIWRLTTSMPTPRPEMSVTTSTVENPGRKICPMSWSWLIALPSSALARPLLTRRAAIFSASMPPPSSAISTSTKAPLFRAERRRVPRAGLPRATRSSGFSMPWSTLLRTRCSSASSICISTFLSTATSSPSSSTAQSLPRSRLIARTARGYLPKTDRTSTSCMPLTLSCSSVSRSAF